MSKDPTDLFPILEPEDLEIGWINVVQDCHAMCFAAPKLWKGRSGDSEVPSSLDCILIICTHVQREKQEVLGSFFSPVVLIEVKAIAALKFEFWTLPTMGFW